MKWESPAGAGLPVAGRKPDSVVGSHPSGTPVSGRLERPTWGWASNPSRPDLALHRVGFTQPACHQTAGALLPHLFTVAADAWAPEAVSFLWHFPWGFPRWPLASTLLCGVRTFLEPHECGPRLPGLRRQG